MQGDISALIERANYISVDDAFEIAQTLKAGTFQYGDAQGGATHRFANLVIERHERIRAAAPEMFEALKIADAILSNTPEFSTTNSGRIPVTKVSEAREIVRAALLRALGGDQNG